MTEQTKQVAAAKQKPIDLVRSQMVGMTDKFASALAGAVPSERFVQVAMNAISANPAVLDADRHSLYTSCMKAATDGLVLDGREAALTTFNTKQPDGTYKKLVQYMPMVRGLVKLMLRSPSVLKVSAHVVYSKDEFEHILGLEETIVHKRPSLGSDRGDPIGAYAIATLREGGQQIVVMDKKQIESVKACAKDKKVWDGPFWDQQWEKTVIRRLSKRVEMGPRLQTAIEHDDENFVVDQPAHQETAEVIDIDQNQDRPARTRAAEKVLAKSAPAKKDAPQKKEIDTSGAIDAEYEDAGPPPADIPPPSEEDII